MLAERGTELARQLEAELAARPNASDEPTLPAPRPGGAVASR